MGRLLHSTVLVRILQANMYYQLVHVGNQVTLKLIFLNIDLGCLKKVALGWGHELHSIFKAMFF